MKKVQIKLFGTHPLLMHNVSLADPLNPITRQMKEISSKSKKTDDDYEALARLEFMGGLYYDEELGPYVPERCLSKCLIMGARINRKGPAVQRGVRVTDDMIPLIYEGPRTPEELWVLDQHRHTAAVVVSKARIMRTRPIFRLWALAAEALIDPGVISVETLRQVANAAGTIGLLEFRPRFGTFEATIDEV